MYTALRAGRLKFTLGGGGGLKAGAGSTKMHYRFLLEFIVIFT